MPKTYVQLWDQEGLDAENSSFKKMLLHSDFVRRNLKSGSDINNLTTVLTNSVANLGEGTLVDIIEEKAISFIIKVSCCAKNGSNPKPKKEVKHTLKDLNTAKLESAKKIVISVFKNLAEGVNHAPSSKHIIKTSTAGYYRLSKSYMFRFQTDIVINSGDSVKIRVF